MFEDRPIVELKEKYELGQRNFRNIELRRADLRGIDLRHADLSKADLSGANLKDADLSGANLSGAYLNLVDLTGANLQKAKLQGAYLIKAYLIKANLRGANLTQAYLMDAYLTKSDFKGANLSGADLHGSKFTGTNFIGAFYARTTHFDATFDARENGLLERSPQSEQEGNTQSQITVEEVVRAFNYLSQVSFHYLGAAMTVKYWDSTRPKFDWLTQFQFNDSTKLIFLGERGQTLDAVQIQSVREWSNRFIKSCSIIIRNFTRIVDPKQIAFSIPALKNVQKTISIPTSNNAKDVVNLATSRQSN
jgi:uncharacterized protein YjbI with pentapeptide repeats